MKKNEKSSEHEMISQVLEKNSPLDLNTILDLEEPAKKLWIDVFSGNRIPANGMTVEFVSPKIVDGEIEVGIEDAMLKSRWNFGKLSLIMYVLGRDLNMNGVKQYMMRFWNFIQLTEMYNHEKGYFLLKFRSFKDKDMVLMGGPYTIHNMHVVLKEWSPDFDFKRDMLHTLPGWVKLPNYRYTYGELKVGEDWKCFGEAIIHGWMYN